MVPADNGANNVVVVCRLHYINTFKQELDGTRAYQETNTDEMSVHVVNAHLNELPVKFFVCVNDGQDKLPTMYWLPTRQASPYKARFIANSCIDIYAHSCLKPFLIGRKPCSNRKTHVQIMKFTCRLNMGFGRRHWSK